MKLLGFLVLTILPLAGQVIFTDNFNAANGAINSSLEQRQSGGALQLSWIPVPVAGQSMDHTEFRTPQNGFEDRFDSLFIISLKSFDPSFISTLRLERRPCSGRFIFPGSLVD